LSAAFDLCTYACANFEKITQENDLFQRKNDDIKTISGLGDEGAVARTTLVITAAAASETLAEKFL
jgi:hypothetical protein